MNINFRAKVPYAEEYSRVLAVNPRITQKPANTYLKFLPRTNWFRVITAAVVASRCCRCV